MAQTRTKLTNDQKIARIRDSYEGLNKRDLERAHLPFSDDAVWHGVERDFRGKQALMESARKIMELEGFKIEPHDILANDEHVVALNKVTIRNKGQTAEFLGAEVFHLNEAGKIEEGWAHYDAEKMKTLIGG
jgi:nuclear transport factor 2 (NTF2) superfamily protein